MITVTRRGALALLLFTSCSLVSANREWLGLDRLEALGVGVVVFAVLATGTIAVARRRGRTS